MSTVATDISTQPTQLIDESTYLKVVAEYRLCKLLQREKKVYLTNAHRRVAYGLTNDDFDSIIAKLVSMNFCTRSTTEKHSGVLTLVESPSALVRAMQDDFYSDGDNSSSDLTAK